MSSCLIFTLIVKAWAQAPAPGGLEPKISPAAYEASYRAATLSLAANYMGRSFAARGKDETGRTQLHEAGDFVVIEVALFPGKSFDGPVSASDFRLRFDSRTERIAESPGLVAYALRNRESDPQRRRWIVGGGAGNAGVVLGAPRLEEQFPGDPRPGQQRAPASAQVREAEQRRGDAAIESSLVEGHLAGPRAGNLFFFFDGKMTKVKSLVLVYESATGKHELKLR